MKVFLMVGACVVSARLRATPNLHSVHDQVAFLSYLRENVPELYQDFVVRNDAIEFLDTAQNAVDRLEFPEGNDFFGRELTVYAPKRSPKLNGATFESFRNELESLGRTYSDRDRPIFAALALEAERAARLDGLDAGLAQSSAKGILRLPDAEKVAALREIFLPNEKVAGVDPRRLGIPQDYFTGAELLSTYQTALAARRAAIPLYWLAALARHLNLREASVDELIARSRGVSDEVWGAALAAKFPSDPKLRKRAKDAAPSAGVATAEPRLTLTRAHPFAAWLRGSVGDCSTDTSFGTSLARAEEFYWIRTPQDRKIRGYLQLTHLKVDGEDALYVNTISGAEINRDDVKRSLQAVFHLASEIHIKHVVIPVPETLASIINYPEVDVVFRTLGTHAPKVTLDYTDADDRVKLVPFTEGKLDLPETHKVGAEIFPDAPTDEVIEDRTFAIRADELFPAVSQENALLVALELGAHGGNKDALPGIIRSFGISPEAFGELNELLRNPQADEVKIFQTKVLQQFARLGLPFDPHVLELPFMFRGHFAAPDALARPHFELALRYLKTYLLSYSDLPYVFETLAPKFSTLVKEPEFTALVRHLFRKNLKEMGRLLDPFELETRSAYRTLANLFAAGLPTPPFHASLDELRRPLEEGPNFAGRREGVYLRRATLLGMIEATKGEHFVQLMHRLETIAAEKTTLDPDDLRTVSAYFSFVLKRADTSPAQTERIFNFLVGSEFGLSFTRSLGQFPIEKIDVPGLVEVLFREKQYLWTAYLVHKDPWPQHSLAPGWLATFHAGLGASGNPVFLEGLQFNASWLDVPGADVVIDGMLSWARENVATETTLTRILLKRPQALSIAQIVWLSNASTAALADLILGTLDAPSWQPAVATWLRHRLKMRFPRPCQLFLTGGTQ